MWDNVTVFYPDPPVADLNGELKIIFKKSDNSQLEYKIDRLNPNQLVESRILNAKIEQAIRIIKKNIELQIEGVEFVTPN